MTLWCGENSLERVCFWIPADLRSHPPSVIGAGMCRSTLQRITGVVCCNMLQRVMVCYSVLQCVEVSLTLTLSLSLSRDSLSQYFSLPLSQSFSLPLFLPQSICPSLQPPLFLSFSLSLFHNLQM